VAPELMFCAIQWWTLAVEHSLLVSGYFLVSP